ncbi:MAG: Sua5/YciO/YrdC/YwlC family protein, partial [Candidatus Nitrotoga sp.]|nr:Sua5/YciO/YrdC/YwlC family protein [Candidatus Nitrotoga sp.]
MSLDRHPKGDTGIQAAAALLKAGGTVAFPTETVYGLGADASNPSAVRSIFQIKGRPDYHPLIIHIAQASHLSVWAQDIPDTAYQLAAAFWPGPLTLILKRSHQVPDEV